jgi:hypothetical protein
MFVTRMTGSGHVRIARATIRRFIAGCSCRIIMSADSFPHQTIYRWRKREISTGPGYSGSIFSNSLFNATPIPRFKSRIKGLPRHRARGICDTDGNHGTHLKPWRLGSKCHVVMRWRPTERAVYCWIRGKCALDAGRIHRLAEMNDYRRSRR